MKCSNCSQSVPTKEPRCPHCGRWGTIARWRAAEDLEQTDVQRISSGAPEIDWLLGGGWVPGCVYRLSGPPGCGKSTVALDLAMRIPSVYASAEETTSMLRMRFDRLQSPVGRMAKLGEISCVEDVEDIPEDVQLVVVDSLHCLHSRNVTGAAASNSQLLHAVEEIVALARMQNYTVLVIAHVNKDGDSAGTTGVDHLVDALLEMEPDNTIEGGTIKVGKNRHGPKQRSLKAEILARGLRYEKIENSREKIAERIHAEREEADS